MGGGGGWGEGKGGEGGDNKSAARGQCTQRGAGQSLFAGRAGLSCTSCPLTLCGHGARSTLSWRTGLRHNVCGTCQAGYTASSTTDTTQGVQDMSSWLHRQFHH